MFAADLGIPDFQALFPAMATNIIAIAIQAPSYEDRWGPFPKPEHHRSEAACSWVVNCRPS